MATMKNVTVTGTIKGRTILVPFLVTSTFNHPENTTAIATLSAAANTTPSFALAGGADASKFNLTSGGVLTFLVAPDFETPNSSLSTNAYTFNVTITDAYTSATVPVTVNVTDVADNWVTPTSSVFLASDIAANDQYGSFTAISGDGLTAVVTAPFKNSSTGAAYVFTRNGNTWTQQQKIVPNTPLSGSQFGYAAYLSRNGNTLIVGANFATISSLANAGSVYVFTRSGSTWTQQQQITATPAAGAQFGAAVSLSADGNTALVGEYGKNNSTGNAHTFTRSGSTWTYQTTLTASDATTLSDFGFSLILAPDGNTAMIGARRRNSYTGAVYAYTRVGSVWTQRQIIVASDAAVNMHFGRQMGVSDNANTLVIGGFGRNTNTGAGYYYTRSGNTWTQQQIITSSDAATNRYFGVSVRVSLDGTMASLGSHSHTSGIGSLGVFIKDGASFVQRALLTDNTLSSSSYYGVTNALSEDGLTLIAGAPFADNTATDAGRAYGYRAF